MRDLQSSLRDHSMVMIRVIAELDDVELTTNVRDDASAQVAAALKAPESLPAILHRCSADAQAAWAALVAAGGQMKVPVFARRFGAPRPAGPGKLERDMPWREPANPAEELWYRGLMYRAFADLGQGPAEFFYIPGDLLPASTPVAADAGGVHLAPLPAGQAPAEIQRAFSLAIDACTLMAEFTSSPLRVDASGDWRPTDEMRLRGTLLLQDPVRFALLLTLARGLGWLSRAEQPGGRLSVRADTLGEWLHAPAWVQRTTLFEAWQDSVEWNDLRRMPSVRPEGDWRNDPLLARRAILTALARLRPGAWYSIAGLIAWIKEIDPDFQRPEGNYAGWYLRDVATGRYLSGFESWDDVEGRLIYFLITEPLFWLAATELGVAQEGHGEVFRITPAGAAWLCGQPPPELPAPAKLLVDEEFTVAAPLSVPLVDRYRLLRFTEPASELPGPGQPTRHRITRRSLSRARATGLKAGRIIQFLQHASGGRVPSRVETALRRWEQHGGTIRITRGALLRVQDASILATLRADPALAPLLGELVSAQAVLVAAANVPRLVSALAELGYTAQVDG